MTDIFLNFSFKFIAVSQIYKSKTIMAAIDNKSVVKITISSIVIGLKNSYFPLTHLPSCYRTVCYWTVCYRTVQ